MEETIEKITQDLIAAAKRFYEARFQLGNGGNLSARYPGKEWMIVKGTDVAFSEVSEKTLVITDFNGALVSGSIKPSKEALLHGALYRRLPDVQAIMHCHSPWATGWAASGKPLEFATYHSKLKLKGEVPVFDSGTYAVPEDFFPTILAHFDRYPEARAFLLKGHGQLAVGKNVWDAAYNAELVEETAQIGVISVLMGTHT
ncbi:class II aldolase/adducin family protein [Treponema primitia]|uniref:class II aldolase/adducin family protein n=1 Tax=Treponema primitia TaxID=88058 RepID=UPI0039816F72